MTSKERSATNENAKALSLKIGLLSYYKIILDKFYAKIKSQLNKPLPGFKVYSSMSPSPSKYSYNKPDCRISSVLILLYKEKNKIFTILTKRSQKVRHHKGQISFPGGEKEPIESIRETAIREAHEEIGIKKNEIYVLGSLSEIYIPLSNFIIHPILAYSQSKPRLKINTDEVEHIIAITIDDLMNQKSLHNNKKIQIGSKSISVPCFIFQDNIVWGATSMVLKELKEIIKLSINQY